MLGVLVLLVAFSQTNAWWFSGAEGVGELELKKYTGRWYEIKSSLIQKATFQRNSYCTCADYSLRDDGTIKVFNSGRIGSPTGDLNSIVGTAKVLDPKQPGELNVQFPTGPKQSGANYIVVKLGPVNANGLYDYTIITTRWKVLTWVLARDPETYQQKYGAEVDQYLKNNGYDWFWNRPRPTVQSKECKYPQPQ